ncbi:MAG: hypothetical protein ACPGTQ_00180 [Colwellia sp.]
MRLSRAGWNNVIIFSVMLIILMINVMNDKLFPNATDVENTSSIQTMLPEHSAIVVFSIAKANQQVIIQRTGTTWLVQQNTKPYESLDAEKSSQQSITQSDLVETISQNTVEQLISAWQNGSGLLQADDIIVKGLEATLVEIKVAKTPSKTYQFRVYPLKDQLLILNQQNNQWLSLPAAMSKQLLLIIK